MTAVQLTVTNNDSTQLLLWPVPVQNHVESYQHPWQPGSFECEDAQKAQPRVGVAPTPDVDECRAESGTEEGLT